jgi:hypothetical protein
MSRNTAMRCFRAAVLPAALALLPALSSLAQQSVQSSKPHWSVITVTTVKPDMRDQHEAYQKELTAAFKKAEVPSRVVLDSVMGDLLEYVSIYPIANFAELDGGFPAERALGKEGYTSLRAKLSGTVTSVRRLAALEIEDLRIRTDVKEPMPYGLVMFVRAAPGKGPEFEAWLKNDYFPVMKKAELKNFSVSRNVFGSNPNEYVVVRLMEKLGEIDAGPPLRKVLGAEGADKLMAKTAGIVDSVEYRIYRYRPELSYEMAVQTRAQR